MSRSQTLELLDAVSAHLTEAEAALMNEDCLAVIRQALEARRLCRRVLTFVLAGCLRDLTAEAREMGTAQSEEEFESLVRVVRFAASELCSPCRQALGVMLKDGV